jgi:hypothetical protein
MRVRILGVNAVRYVEGKGCMFRIQGFRGKGLRVRVLEFDVLGSACGL